MRFAVRTLRNSPGLAVLAVLCMGLGIGAVTSMYSTAEAFTLRPLPQVRDADRVVHVWEGPAAFPQRDDGMSPGTLRDLRGMAVFGGVVAMRFWSANIVGTDEPEQVSAARVSAGSMHALGRVPQLGRDFTASDDEPAGSHVVLLGYGLWQRRFGGDRGILGRVVRINGEGYTVVGVMPEDFVFPSGTQLWAPLALGPEDWAVRDHRNVFVLARLAPGVTEGAAETAVSTLGARLAAAYPAASAGYVMRAEPAVRYFGAGPRPFMNVLLAAAVFVLLIACADVANLLLSRATARRRELAIRIALGASRPRIVRQQLTESVVIAVAGGALGVLIAWWGLGGLATSVPVEVRAFIPGFGELHLDGRALILTLVVAVGSGLTFGLVPAFAATRVDVQGSLKEGARGDVGGARSGGGRLRSALVVAEVALALVLLVGAAQTLGTYRRLALTDPGFRSEDVLTLGVTLPAADYPADSDVVRFYRNLEDRLANLPGVTAVGATTVLPLSWSEDRRGVTVEGSQPRRPEDVPRLGLRLVSPGYLEALQVPLLKGRALGAADDAGAPPVAEVSTAAAAFLWPGADPLGKRFKVASDQWVQVVGVVGDVRGNPLMGGDTRLVVYLPERQRPARITSLVLRATGDPLRLAPLVQREIGALDSRLAAGSVLPMRRVIASALSPQSATAQTLAVAAVIALLLACIGLYGVMAYSVSQRTQEIGVRVALGASSGGVVRLVLRQALLLTLVGVLLGAAGSLALSRGLQAILVGSRAGDPVILALVACLLGAVAAAASTVPALRAARVDPMEALRSE
ncbi:MAG TPA: ABC transporter permease [Gemmatimonadales bacterium]|nr:ABC transporter permease [Gemmatimonadales bacterium]